MLLIVHSITVSSNTRVAINNTMEHYLVHIVDNIFWTRHSSHKIIQDQAILCVEDHATPTLYQTSNFMLLHTNALNFLKDIYKTHKFLKKYLHTTATIVCGDIHLTLPTLAHFLRTHHGMRIESAVAFLEERCSEVVVPLTEMGRLQEVHDFVYEAGAEILNLDDNDTLNEEDLQPSITEDMIDNFLRSNNDHNYFSISTKFINTYLC
ncbi:ORF44 [Cydia pomonella granulovirus]|uniref:ORF44 n=2 Tax=Cydia pomonella granulosis virus TaxID=28289 RepID=Q76T44_GVCPM|nr:ORF44 [Cydia pomonella granulovirus]AAB64424.1 ORF36L [Cydia pomonella granulovirus]AAK70704.1 ORF44 [Cydia pomonella granulovirus]AIU36832.1 ORF44 orf36L [Cydia pomonella granulovirus]AIU36969.1 ORF44 orf36L [Cydia pomonella granulovirus]AIU37111.1 ORF44 orf36L [Cydia pomonella granulovirus]